MSLLYNKNQTSNLTRDGTLEVFHPEIFAIVSSRHVDEFLAHHRLSLFMTASQHGRHISVNVCSLYVSQTHPESRTSFSSMEMCTMGGAVRYNYAQMQNMPLG